MVVGPCQDYARYSRSSILVWKLLITNIDIFYIYVSELNTNISYLVEIKSERTNLEFDYYFFLGNEQFKRNIEKNMQKSGGVQTNLRPDISPFVKFTKADNSLFVA